jgi:pimeloyl-ACP methyl ester carboxylesterase
MKEFALFILLLVACYLLFAAFLYVYQRKLLYHPVRLDPSFKADEITIDSNGTRLHGWILNPGQARAVIYFGGNSELITHRSDYFEQVFADYSVYLVNYRGYGNSEGSPTEAALFADALAIYDHIQEKYQTVSAYGRSLGSGVAVYLAAKRPLDRLILLTPYDSIAAVAQKIYPLFPVRYLTKDQFDSAARAGNIDIPVLIASAEHDREIALEHTQALRQRFNRTEVEYRQIKGAAHNDIIDFPEYRAFIEGFIAED